MKKITLNNIKNYLQGNIREFFNKVNLLPEHIKEQVIYRSSKCQDCLIKKQCKQCGCEVPGRWFTTETCSNRFPDLMNKDEWREYKEKNKIEYNIHS